MGADRPGGCGEGEMEMQSNRFRSLLTVGLIALVVAGCGDKKGDAPAGQVVAQVKGEDVTIHELNAEIQASNFPPSVPRKQAEQQALQNIVTRRLLMDAAKERKLDQNPQYLLQQRRAGEVILVQTLAREIAQKLPPVTQDDARRFMRENPNMFEQRKILVLDQIQFLRPANIDKLGLQGAKTMADVIAVLQKNNIEFRRGTAALDALQTAPEFMNEVLGLYARNPQEVFMFANQPQGAPAPIMLVNQVREVRTEPFTGDRAMQFAQNLLQQTRVNTALQDQVNSVRKAAEKDISYQPGYAPPAPAKPAAGQKAATATPPATAPAAAK